MKPPTLQQVIEYCQEKQLAVDPEWFYNYFEAGDWIDSKGSPVKSWKQKLWTHHRMQLERGGMPKCGYGYCKKPGVYIIGKDRDGHPYRYCIDHKPQPKPLPAEHPAHTIKFKKVPDGNKQSKSDRVNELREGLGL